MSRKKEFILRKCAHDTFASLPVETEEVIEKRRGGIRDGTKRLSSARVIDIYRIKPDPDQPPNDDPPGGRGERPTDSNHLAKWIVDQTTDENRDDEQEKQAKRRRSQSTCECCAIRRAALLQAFARQPYY